MAKTWGRTRGGAGRAWLLPVAAAALFVAGGCGDDIVGEWEYDGSGWDLELTIKEDGDGKLKEDDSGNESRWDVKWEERSNDFKLEVECDSGDCVNGEQFDLECSLDEDELEVEDGPGDWNGVVFERVN